MYWGIVVGAVMSTMIVSSGQLSPVGDSVGNVVGSSGTGMPSFREQNSRRASWKSSNMIDASSSSVLMKTAFPSSPDVSPEPVCIPSGQDDGRRGGHQLELVLEILVRIEGGSDQRCQSEDLPST